MAHEYSDIRPSARCSSLDSHAAHAREGYSMRSSPDGKVSNERRTLWIVLLLNAAIAAGFFVTGLVGDSSALIANGVDNLSDTAVYALSLIALSHGRTWKTRAATVSGVMLLIFAVGRSEAHTSELQSLMR